MLAPDPVLAGLVPAAKAAASRANPGGSPVAEAPGPGAAGAVAPAFDLLAEAVAALPAGAGADAGKPAMPRSKAAAAARAPAAATPDPAGVIPVATPTLPLPGASLAAAAPAGALALPAAIAPPVADPRAADPAPAAAAAITILAPPTEPAEAVPAERAAPDTSDGASKVQRPAIRSAEAGGAVSVPSADALGDDASRARAETAPLQPSPSPPVAGGWQLVAQPAAAPPVAGEPPAPVRPEAVAGQVAVAVARSGGSARKVELRLDPPELGRVEIHLAPGDRGSLHATVIAERAETHDLLRRHGELLARELGAAGYADVTLSFSGGSDAGRGGQPARLPEPPGTAFVVPLEDEPRAVAAAPHPPSVAPAGLDIRL